MFFGLSYFNETYTTMNPAVVLSPFSGRQQGEHGTRFLSTSTTYTVRGESLRRAIT